MALKYDLPTAGNVAGASPMIIRHRSAAAPDHPGRGARSNTNAEPTLIIRKDGTVCDRILKAGDSHVLRHMAEAVWVGGTLVVVVVGGGGAVWGFRTRGLVNDACTCEPSTSVVELLRRLLA